MLEERQRRMAVPFTDLTRDAQAAFCIDAERYINFELGHSDEAFTGMPVIGVAQTDTGFIVETHKKGAEQTVQQMRAAETISGIIDRAYVWAIAPYAMVVRGEAASIQDIQLSVLLKIGQAVFETEGKQYELDAHYDTYIPLSYPRLAYEQPDLHIL